MPDALPDDSAPPASGQTLSVLDKLKHKARAHNRNYLTQGYTPQDATVSLVHCPNCGAARAGGSDLRLCAYCQHPFLRDPAEG